MAIAEIFATIDVPFIIMAVIANVVVFLDVRNKLAQVRTIINPQASMKHGCIADITINSNTLNTVDHLKTKIVSRYSLYANITAIFPLLGILGTVAALITISDDTNMMDNLMVALDTTLYGVLGAIIFKFMDSQLSGPIDSLSDDYLVLTQNYKDEKAANGGDTDEE